MIIASELVVRNEHRCSIICAISNIWAVCVEELCPVEAKLEVDFSTPKPEEVWLQIGYAMGHNYRDLCTAPNWRDCIVFKPGEHGVDVLWNQPHIDFLFGELVPATCCKITDERVKLIRMQSGSILASEWWRGARSPQQQN